MELWSWVGRKTALLVNASISSCELLMCRDDFVRVGGPEQGVKLLTGCSTVEKSDTRLSSDDEKSMNMIALDTER